MSWELLGQAIDGSSIKRRNKVRRFPRIAIDPDTFETSRLAGVVGDQMAADAQNSGEALLEPDRELRRFHRIVGALSLPLSMFTRLRSNRFFVLIANRVDEMLDADFER